MDGGNAGLKKGVAISTHSNRLAEADDIEASM